MAADGKHLRVDARPFRIRGTTYGTFGERGDGALYPETERVAADFAAMRRAGLNTARVYTVPPRDVLDLAAEHGLRLLVGLDYADWRLAGRTGRSVSRTVLDAGRRAVDAALNACAGRPEVLAISVGNEIPGDLVRVHGIRTVEDVLAALVAEVHAGDPAMLATYTNFPTTEYLSVDGQDMVTFNVFLERPEQLRSYLRHLHVVAGEIPLVITELGLAAGVHGDDAQAESLEWQLRLVDEEGCAGATVFSWTDDWVVGGAPVAGWGFGLTDELRRPRPALDVVSRWARSSLCELRPRWPRMSAVVCAYNAADTIDACLASLTSSAYPGFRGHRLRRRLVGRHRRARGAVSRPRAASPARGSR